MAANYAVGTIGYDTTFELNEFNEPRIRSEIETVKNVLLYVLLSKPGQYPSLPLVGMDIQNMLYTNYDELNVEDLKTQMISQCSMLGVYFNSGAVQFRKTIYKKKPSLLIQVAGNEIFPPGYKSDTIGDSSKYLIGLTLDELNKLIYNVNLVRE